MLMMFINEMLLKKSRDVRILYKIVNTYIKYEPNLKTIYLRDIILFDVLLNTKRLKIIEKKKRN